jgi:hypothetical protein
MSRLFEKLKKYTMTETQPIGFGVTKVVTKLRPLLIARLTSQDIGNLAGQLVGADAIIILVSNKGQVTNTKKELNGTTENTIWGGWLKDDAAEVAQMVHEAGGDFVVFNSAITPLILLENKELGKVLAVDVSLESDLLRAVASIPADVVLAVGEALESPILSWQHLMSIQRLADFIRQPLLVPVSSKISATELEVLWGSGVAGVVVELSGKESMASFGELREVIDGIEFSSRRRDKTGAVLPKSIPYSNEAAIMPDEESEDE